MYGKKLAIVSFNKTNELLKQRSEILNAYGHKNARLLGRKIFFNVNSCSF